MKVRSMRGVEFDPEQIMAVHEKTIAIGNAKMNARGDQLGAGGRVVKRREQVSQDYHNANPKSVRKVSLKDVEPDTYLSPAEAVKQATEMAAAIRAGTIEETKPVDNGGLMSGTKKRRVVDDPEDGMF